MFRAAARRQPETRDSVRRWHRLEADRRRGLGREGGQSVAVEGEVPRLWSGAPRAEGDRLKRAREDRAGLRGRAAVQRARAGASGAVGGSGAQAQARGGSGG